MTRAHGALAAADRRDQRELVAGARAAPRRRRTRGSRPSRPAAPPRGRPARRSRPSRARPPGSSIESSIVPARSRSCAKRRTVTCMVRRCYGDGCGDSSSSRHARAGDSPGRSPTARTSCAATPPARRSATSAACGRCTAGSRSSPRRRARRRSPGVDVMEATPEFEAEHERRSLERPLRARRPARPRDGRRGRPARGRLVQRRPLPRAEPGAHAPAAARAHDRAPDPPDDDAARAAGREAGARLLPGRAEPAACTRAGARTPRARCGCRSRARTRTRRGGGGSRSRRSHAMLRAAGFEPVEQWGDPFAVHVIARPLG